MKEKETTNKNGLYCKFRRHLVHLQVHMDEI